MAIMHLESTVDTLCPTCEELTKISGEETELTKYTPPDAALQEHVGDYENLTSEEPRMR